MLATIIHFLIVAAGILVALGVPIGVALGIAYGKHCRALDREDLIDAANHVVRP